MSGKQGTRVHVVATCTKRKKYPPLPGLQAGELGNGTPEERAEAWIRQLQCTTGKLVSARDLYAGDHWDVVLSIPEAAPALDVCLWVCSAGYGLIPADAPVAPYSATFSHPHPDAVHGEVPARSRADAQRRWWKRLGEWSGPAPGQPRTLRALAEACPDDSLIVIASAPYLRAMGDDLAEAASALRTPDQLSIVSAAARHLRGLSENTVPFDARFQQLWGGADMSLNPRVARELLRSGAEPRRSDLLRAVEELGAGLQRPRVVTGTPQTDDQVRRFIRAGLTGGPLARCTPLLRKLRSELGLACEQKRFKKLYEETAAELAAETSPGAQPPNV